MGANGDRATSRRSKRRGGKPLTPTEAGEMLRKARDQSRDRVGRGPRSDRHLVEEPGGPRVRGRAALLRSGSGRSCHAPVCRARLDRPRPSYQVCHCTPRPRSRRCAGAGGVNGSWAAGLPRRRSRATSGATTGTTPTSSPSPRPPQVPAVGGRSVDPANRCDPSR